MVRFVAENDIDSRYWEKPYYLVPDGDEADEGYSIMQRALAETGKVAIGQLIMHGRQHLVGIKVLKGGLMLSSSAMPLNYAIPNRTSRASTLSRSQKQSN